MTVRLSRVFFFFFWYSRYKKNLFFSTDAGKLIVSPHLSRKRQKEKQAAEKKEKEKAEAEKKEKKEKKEKQKDPDERMPAPKKQKAPRLADDATDDEIRAFFSK